MFHQIEDQFQAMAKAKWLTTLHIAIGYHQIKLVEDFLRLLRFNSQRAVSVESVANEDEGIRGGIFRNG